MASTLRIPVNSKDHFQGNEHAPIEMVEYGDYQCPYCGKAFYEIKTIKKELGDKLKFVFRNFPLSDIHENALTAAISAEVAGDFGKFWEMHDTLFEKQNALEDNDLIHYAEEIGINIKDFGAKLSDNKYQEKVEEDMEGGLRSGVNGTPSFYINGQKYNGEYTAEAILDHIQMVLARLAAKK